MKALQAHIMMIAKEEPYMGEKIPLRWLKFEEAKGTAQEEVMKMDKVLYNYFKSSVMLIRTTLIYWLFM